ncbi:MAG: hypothetical protein ACK56F_31205, partial [bacterium]
TYCSFPIDYLVGGETNPHKEKVVFSLRAATDRHGEPLGVVLAHEQLNDSWSLRESRLGPLRRPLEAEPQQLRLWCAVAGLGYLGNPPG